MKVKIVFGLLLAVLSLSAQQIILPEGLHWNVVEEGKTLAFKLNVKDSVRAKRYLLSGINGYNMTLDSVGNFSWRPGFDVVNRLERVKEVSAIVEVEFMKGNRVQQPITIKVLHVNRPPVAESLPVFYVKQASGNTYQLASDFVYDPDDDPIVIKPYQNQLPEGVQMSSSGVITWSPSRNQFNSLKTTQLFIDFVVQDQPEKAEVRGKFRVVQTQLDLPPEILLVPGDSTYEIKEDGLLNIKIYMSDPNGDDNIAAGGFVTSDSRITAAVLKENTKQQSEFIWTPGYKFVDETEKFRLVDLTFYVLDKSNNRIQKKVKVKINDAENLDEKDKLLFQKYRSSLVSAKNLIDQLDENHDVLNKAYKQAKKGKRQRAIINASLGATTGISPVILDPEQSKIVSGIGGTTVLTLGTLEATEVLGKSKSDILDKLKINVEIRNQLQVEGDNFARKHALKSSRRQKEFDADREKLLPIINNQKLVLLELDALQRSRTPDNKAVKKTFPDFADEY